MATCPYCKKEFSPLDISRHKSACREKRFNAKIRTEEEEALLEHYYPSWVRGMPFCADWVLYEGNIYWAEILFGRSRMSGIVELALYTTPSMVDFSHLYVCIAEWNPNKFEPVPGNKKKHWSMPVSRWSHDYTFNRGEALRHIKEFLGEAK